MCCLKSSFDTDMDFFLKTTKETPNSMTARSQIQYLFNPDICERNDSHRERVTLELSTMLLHLVPSHTNRAEGLQQHFIELIKLEKK